MKSALLFTLALGFAGCQAEKATYQPTRPEPTQLPVRADAARSEERFTNYSDDAAERFLTQRVAEQIEAEIRRRDAERVELDAEQAAAERAAVERAVQSYPVERYEARRHSPSPIPWNTLFLGGLGAVIGHQSGHRDRGFAIGAGLGLLHDVMRWRSW